jgi:uncharacterized LabA/DUF88 family protein
MTAVQSQPNQVACVVDLDNLLHRGFDKRSGTAKPQGQLDILGLSAALRQRGVACGTICRNWDFPPLAQQLWAKLGFKVVASRHNCDDDVISEAESYAEAGVAQLILVGGDGDYTKAVKALRARGIRVEIWSRKASTSEDLAGAADSVRYIDRYLTMPRPANPPMKVAA